MKRGAIRVTIGLPVYNGERTLRAALEGLTSQTWTASKLIVADNGSTDGTPDIGAEVASRDPRVVYVRHATNLGPAANFRFVLDHADTDYFMWAAADDVHSPDFVESNVAFLDERPDFVGSICRARFTGGDYDPQAMGDETCDDPTAGERILRFFGCWHANSRFYSVFRRRDLLAAMAGLESYLASDWAVMIKLLSRGKLNRLPFGSLERGRDGASNRRDYLLDVHSRPIHWLLPFEELFRATLATVRSEPVRVQLRVLDRLLRLNGAAVRLKARLKLARVVGRRRASRG